MVLCLLLILDFQNKRFVVHCSCDILILSKSSCIRLRLLRLMAHANSASSVPRKNYHVQGLLHALHLNRMQATDGFVSFPGTLRVNYVVQEHNVKTWMHMQSSTLKTNTMLL